MEAKDTRSWSYLCGSKGEDKEEEEKKLSYTRVVHNQRKISENNVWEKNAFKINAIFQKLHLIIEYPRFFLLLYWCTSGSKEISFTIQSFC